MGLVNRRRVLVVGGGLIAGAGYMQFFHSPTPDNIETSDETGNKAGIIYDGDPTRISKSGEAYSEPFEIGNVGPTVITFKSNNPKETRVTIYSISEGSGYDIHKYESGVGGQIFSLPTGPYDLNVSGSPGEWVCSIYDYSKSLDTARIKPPFEASGVGDAPIGPIKINPDYPTKFSGSFADSGVLRLVDRRGNVRKPVYRTENSDEYTTEEHFGGVGFFEIISSGEWGLEVEQLNG